MKAYSFVLAALAIVVAASPTSLNVAPRSGGVIPSPRELDSGDIPSATVVEPRQESEDPDEGEGEGGGDDEPGDGEGGEGEGGGGDDEPGDGEEPGDEERK